MTAVVTARVYPSSADSDRVGVYNRGRTAVTAAAAEAWLLGSASVSKAQVLRPAEVIAG